MERQTMFGSQTVQNEKPTAEVNASGRHLLDSVGIGPGLRQLMGLQADGTPLTAFQLPILPNNALPATLAQQAQYLASPQAMGGHEKLVSANRDAYLTHARNAVQDALMAGDGPVKYAEVVRQVRNVVVDLRVAYETTLSGLEKRRMAAEEKLRKYQDEAAKASGKATGLMELVRQVLGDYVKVPDAIRGYNEREVQTLQCDCQRAAIEVAAQIIAMCERLLSGMGTIREASQAGEKEAQQRIESLTREAEAHGRTADYMVNIERVIDTETVTDTFAAYLPKLIAEARDNGGGNLTKVAHGIATHLVATEYGPLNIVALMRREGAGATVNGKAIDPERVPLLVASRVLDIARRKRLSLGLTSDARPHDFVLQISANERPLFGHPSLVAARYRKPRNEFAFVCVRTDVALDELTVIRAGEKDFHEKQQRRESECVKGSATTHVRSLDLKSGLESPPGNGQMAAWAN